ncbi:MAG: endonuclease III domain-containing protein [Methanosarcina sp.]
MKKNTQNFSSKKTKFQTTLRTDIRKIYDCLLASYGPQGWWPLIELCEAGGSNPIKTGSLKGYHPADYTFPESRSQQFEIICGTLLTQNTSWTQVEKALLNLKKLNALSPEALITLCPELLKEAIKPAGYYNQKALRLQNLASWFMELEDRVPEREELLSLKGVGPETADSILLYAFKTPSFVVDAYTRRIVTNLGLADEKADYNYIKALFEENLPQDPELYQEYHALLVEHAKRYYQKRTAMKNACFLKIV